MPRHFASSLQRQALDLCVALEQNIGIPMHDFFGEVLNSNIETVGTKQKKSVREKPSINTAQLVVFF